VRQWWVLYQKEMTEMWRNGKWLWVPVVFVLLGIMNPISSYYMPEILKSAGNLPEGAVIQIPMPKPPEVLVETLSQYGTLGVLILVLASMGVVSAERTSGIAAMILVKPVSYFSYITAKWAGLLSLMAVSFSAGYFAAWYYTEALIGPVELSRVASGFLVYGLWLIFVLTVTMFMSIWLKGGGAIAFITIAITAALSILTGLFSRYMTWSPSRLAGHAGSFLTEGTAASRFGLTLGITALLIVVLLAAGVSLFRRQELVE